MRSLSQTGCSAMPSPRAWSLILRSMLALTLGVVLVTAVSVPADAGAWKGKDVTVEGATHVMNPAEPMNKAVTLTPEKLWRIGGDTDNEDEFFGLITQALIDKDGNIYLLDSQLSEIKVFDAKGQYLRSIGREGEGPGEFRAAANMCFLPDGNIGVVQLAPGRIVMLSPDGEPAGEHPLPTAEDGGAIFLLRAGSTGKYMVLAYMKNKFAEGVFDQSRILGCIDEDGKEAVRLYEETRTIDFANPVIDEVVWDTFDRRWTVGPDGRVFAVTTHSDYQVRVWNTDGTPDRVIEREYKRLPRTAEDKEFVRGIYEAFTRQVPNATVKIDDNWTDIQSIHPRDDGTLWVLTSRGGVDVPDGTLGVFDVFDKQGRFLTQVTLKGEGDPQDDGYFFVGDRLFVVTDFLQAAVAAQGGGNEATQGDEEEPEPMAVICYRLDTSSVIGSE
jgi:hypothetical protein